MKNITKSKEGPYDDFIEVESSEDALELIHDIGKDRQSKISSFEDVTVTSEQQQSRRFSKILTETAENISSAITNTFISLTGGTTEEDIR